MEGNGQRELMLGTGRSPAAGRGRRDRSAGRWRWFPRTGRPKALIPEFTLAENVALGSGTRRRWVHGWWIDWAEARRRTAALLARLRCASRPGPDVPASQLSGGNQQKLVLARALEGDPAVCWPRTRPAALTSPQPRRFMTGFAKPAATGLAVVVYSSDLDEVLALGCDRLVVMARGGLSELSARAPGRRWGRAMLQGWHDP